MKRFYGVLAALFITLTCSIGLAHTQGVTFVASDDELNLALESAAQGTIGSVAIDELFYIHSAKQTKDRTRGLIARAFELGDRLVFVYNDPGPLPDAGLAATLLDASIPQACHSPVFFGKYMRREDPTIAALYCQNKGEQEPYMIIVPTHKEEAQ